MPESGRSGAFQGQEMELTSSTVPGSFIFGQEPLDILQNVILDASWQDNRTPGTLLARDGMLPLRRHPVSTAVA